MTSTEQDKELKSYIVEQLHSFDREEEMFDTYVNRFLQLITADRKRVALEARLDELNAIYGWSQEERTPLIFHPEHRSSDFAQMAAKGMGTNFTVRERIAELKQELEKL